MFMTAIALAILFFGVLCVNFAVLKSVWVLSETLALGLLSLEVGFLVVYMADCRNRSTSDETK